MRNTKPLVELSWIDPNAMEIVDSLARCNYKAYLVGGCVRDYLAGVTPKDFDIATDALPNQVKRLIRRAYVIGRRFRLVLVHRGGVQYEVATFRRDPSEEEKLDDEVQNDNLFGNPEADANRRDFTINALFYDPKERLLIDYVNGLDDIEQRTLRMIGTPKLRIQEDPIRILRALRLSHKLRFQIEPGLRNAIAEERESLKNSALPRKREDLLKILKLPEPEKCLLEMADLGVLESSFPILHKILSNRESQEQFENDIKRISEFVEDWSEPKELLSLLSFAILRSLDIQIDEEEDPSKPCPDSVMQALKEEVGMFKSEIEHSFKAFQLMKSLNDLDTYSRKGKRRQSSFLANESFPCALKLAFWDYQISAETFQFWKEEYQRELPQILQRDQDRDRRNKKQSYGR